MTSIFQQGGPGGRVIETPSSSPMEGWIQIPDIYRNMYINSGGFAIAGSGAIGIVGQDFQEQVNFAYPGYYPEQTRDIHGNIGGANNFDPDADPLYVAPASINLNNLSEPRNFSVDAALGGGLLAAPLIPHQPVGMTVGSDFADVVTRPVETATVLDFGGGGIPRPMEGFGGIAMQLGVRFIPKIGIAINAAANLLNRAGAARLGPITGRGAFVAVTGALGIAQVANWFDNPSDNDQMRDSIEDLLDSGYIAWNPENYSQRNGMAVQMTWVMIPVGKDAERRQAYGLPYKPFSKGDVKKHDQNQDTYRRPSRAPRSRRGQRR